MFRANHCDSLFMTELGIDFEDKRYAYDETWQAKGEEFEGKGLTLTRKLPILEIDEHILWEVGVFRASTS